MNGNMNLGKRVSALEKDGGADIKKEISDLQNAVSDMQTSVSTVQEEITNLENKVNSGHLYSTEEKVVGTWTDGRPVYEKTITYEGAVKTGITIYQDDNIAEIIGIHNKYFYDTNFSSWNSETAGSLQTNIMSRGNVLYGDVADAYKNRISKCRFTIQYTKTQTV